MIGRDDPADADEELLGRPVSSGRRRIGYAFGVVLLGAGVAAGVLTRGQDGHHQAQPVPLPSTTSAGPSTPATPAAPSTPAGPFVRMPSLPDVGSVQLYARAANAVVRIDFAAGRVITTALPPLRSTGPVVFGVTKTGAFVRPIDAVPGYFVPDGAAARPLIGALARTDVLPGPNPDRVWVAQFRKSRPAGLRLVDVATGVPASMRLPIPDAVQPLWSPIQPDGSGYVLIVGAHGAFDLRPDGAHRLPSDLRYGTLLATGSNRLLVATCSSPALQRCPVSLMRLPDGHRTRIGTALAVSGLLVGVISPDARTALIYQPGVPGQLTARVIDLSTGRLRGPPLAVESNVEPGSAVYSGDGRWVFLVGANGTLLAVKVRTGAAQRVDPHLPYLYQLASPAG